MNKTKSEFFNIVHFLVSIFYPPVLQNLDIIVKNSSTEYMSLLYEIFSLSTFLPIFIKL